jgi:hypothetical protein
MSLSASGLRMYDFGTNCSSTLNIQKQAFQETCNQAIYGQEDPPKYDLSMVTARAAILEGARPGPLPAPVLELAEGASGQPRGLRMRGRAMLGLFRCCWAGFMWGQVHSGVVVDSKTRVARWRPNVTPGANDVMATPADVDKVVKEWGAQLVYNKLYPMYSHMDFVWWAGGCRVEAPAIGPGRAATRRRGRRLALAGA